MEILDWIFAHQGDLVTGAGLLWGLVSLVIGLTPSTADDEWLRKVGERISVLKPSNATGTVKLPGASASTTTNTDASALVVLLVVGALAAPTTGCAAGRYRTHLTAAQTAHTVIDQAGAALEQVCTTTRLAELEGAEGAERALRFGERCEAAREGQHAMSELWEDWVTIAAARGLDDPDVAAKAVELSETWAEVTQLVAALGGPTLPTIDLGGAS